MKKFILLSVILVLSSCNVVQLVTDGETDEPDSFFSKGPRNKDAVIVAACTDPDDSQKEVCVYHSEDGLKEIFNINPSVSSLPSNFFTFGNLVYFKADDGTEGTELWSYNKNTNTVQMEENLNPSAASSQPKGFNVINNELYFYADIAAAGNLCKISSPGGAATCVAGTDSYPSVSNLTACNNKLYYTNSGDVFEMGLDGTATVTVGNVGSAGHILACQGTNLNYWASSNLYKYDTMTPGTTQIYGGVGPQIFGIFSNDILFSDNGALFSINNTGGSSVMIDSSFSNSNGDRMIRHDNYGGSYFLGIVNGMDQILKLDPGATSFSTLTSFTGTDNTFLQSISIRDFRILGNKIYVSLEAPISNTALWVFNMEDNTSYRLGQENLDPYQPIAIIED